MTDPEKPAPAKKRVFFKKAAWQTKKDPEETERDIFSHSNEYAAILAEESKRKEEQRRREEEERKRKSQEKHSRKRRRISSEQEDAQGADRKPEIEAQVGKAESKDQVHLSPAPARDKRSLGARYDSLTEASFLPAPQPRPPSNVIDLGDSEPESDEPPYHTASSSFPPSTSKPEPSDDLEEIEDPVVAALEAQARARLAAKDAHDSKVVQLFITSEIPGTRPLIVKYKIGSTLQKARETWCQLQGFSAEMTRDVIFAWKNKKVHDSTKVKRLGIKVDQSGCITVEGTAELYDDEENLPKIHVEAFTEDSFQERERQLEEEAVARKRAARTSPPAEEVIEVEEPPPEKATIKLILKAKSKDDFKLTVHPTTTIEHLTYAYRQSRGIAKDQPITLMFDGERLRPMDTIADTDIEDMDSIEVHFK